MPLYADEKPGSSSSSSSSTRRASAPPTRRLTTDEELPAYDATQAPSSRRERVEHAIHDRSSGKPWLTLRVTSRAANATQRPFILGGEPLVGVVELQLEKTESIQEIKVTVIGDTNTDSTTNKRRPWPFLSLTQILCSTTPTTPPSPAPSEPSQAPNSGFFGRLRRPRTATKLPPGTHRFPFSFTFPSTVTYDGKNFALPATFTEPGALCSATYELAVHIRRGGLSSDAGLATDFAFCPVVRPQPFSPLRRAAYERGSSDIPGPVADPDGWHVLPAVEIDGTMFCDHPARISVQLALAKPLCYTRGTPIPLSLTLSSVDDQALALLSAATAPVVQLLCTLEYQPVSKQTWKDDPKGKSRATIAPGGIRRPATATGVKTSKERQQDDKEKNAMRRMTRVTQRAVWWPDPHAEQGNGCRTLRGELHVSPRLKPALAVPDFQLSYTVILLPFSTSGFVLSAPAAESDAPLAVVPIQIATLHASRGIAPVAATPPSYEDGGRWPLAPSAYLEAGSFTVYV